MSIPELFFIAIALSMDAFAVSICKGLSLHKADIQSTLAIGAYFGAFQAFMPFLGYLLSGCFQDAILFYGHWITFFLLCVIGANMAKEAFNPEEESCSASLAVRDMVPLAVATSIDAMAVGVTFSFLQVHIWAAVSIIGPITFLFSIIGVKAGALFGCRYKSKAELAGGAILILMGIKVLVDYFVI